MGLVALTWIRLFMPLLDRGYPQTPSNVGTKGLGFVKQAFLKLQGLSHLDLRMGMRFQKEQAAALHQDEGCGAHPYDASAIHDVPQWGRS